MTIKNILTDMMSIRETAVRKAMFHKQYRLHVRVDVMLRTFVSARLGVCLYIYIILISEKSQGKCFDSDNLFTSQVINPAL